MSVPEHLMYTSEHEWLDVRDGVATVGVTEYAADALGDIVFIQPPETGASIEAGNVCGELESTKSVSDLFAPVAGEVIAVNSAVVDDPGLLNTDPYGAGWLFRVRMTTTADLLDAVGYKALIEAD
jgi:glycine cleavage system H protein